MTRNSLSLKNLALRRPRAQWTDTVLLTVEAEDNLNWWINSLRDWNGNSWIQLPPEMDVYTDASDKGWEIVIGNKSWSVYMNTISRLFCPRVPAPKLRALGSTLAAMAGVPIPDIMFQGNWSSPKIFEKHYRLSSIISNNLSVSTLRIPLEPHMDNS
ncbi:hypothetical protein BGZ96_001101, partial [Linnemannia gamsii]